MVFYVFVIIFLSNPISVAFAQLDEVAVGAVTTQNVSQPPNQCTSTQRSENQRIINECNQSWAEWGITPPPPESELRNVNECSGLFSASTAQGCLDALIAFPVFIYEAAGVGLDLAFPDRSSFEYVSQRGTPVEIRRYVESQFLNRKCNGSYTDLQREAENCRIYSEYGRLDSIEDEERIRLETSCAQTRDSIQCHLNPPTPTVNEEQVLLRMRNRLSSQVQRIQQAVQDRLRINNQITRIKTECNSVDLSLLTTTALVIAAGSSGEMQLPRTREMSNPEGYQSCILEKIGSDAVLRSAFEKESVNYLDGIFSQFSAFKCYNERSRRQLYCEVALATVTGGAALMPTVTRRLGRGALEQVRRVLRLGAIGNSGPRELNLRIAGCVTAACLRRMTVTDDTIEHMNDHSLGEVGNANLQAAVSDVNVLMAELAGSSNTSIKDSLKSFLNRRPPFRPGKVTTFYPEGVTPDDLLRQIPNLELNQLPQGPNLQSVAYSFEHNGARYLLAVCNVDLCEDGARQVSRGGALTLHPVCGNGVRKLLRPTDVFPFVRQGRILELDDIFTPVPCP